MKKFITVIILLAAFFANAQEYNTYLLKKEEEKGKYKGKYYLMTNEKIVGNLSYDKLSSIYTWNSTNPPEYQKDNRVAVYIDKLDAAKANMPSLDTAGVIYYKYGNKRVGFGKIHSFGKFTLPPVYTNATFVNGNAIYGQKLKNGNWKGASATFNTDTKKYEYILLPENKDYTLLSPKLTLFKDINNKYGLMDDYGNILAEAKYDTCLSVFKYQSYNKNTKAKVQSESWIKEKPVSLQNIFVATNSYMESNIYQKTDKLPVFLLKNKEYTILASAKYITKPIKNAVISEHNFPGTNNQSYFYFIRQNKEEYDIISCFGDKPEQKFRYAYLETIKRDSTPGLDYNWNFSEKEDYSEPFRGYSVDSLKLVKYKKEYEEQQKIKAEKEDYIRKVEASAANYTTKLTGSYEKIVWFDNFNKYESAGGHYDESMTLRTQDLNRVKLTLNFKGKPDRYDVVIHKLSLTAEFYVEPATIKAGDSKFTAENVQGYRLFQPESIIKTPDGKPRNDNKIDIKSVSGTYNPLTNEITIYVEKFIGGSFTITAKKTQK